MAARPEFPGPAPTNSHAGSQGYGAEGVYGSNLTVINSGTINGGYGLGGQANAITFTGGTNTLVLEAGYSFGGAVVGAGNDTLALGGGNNASFNANQIDNPSYFTGFSNIVQNGSATWTVSGYTYEQWSVNSGTLQVTNGNTFTIDYTLSTASGSNVTVQAGAVLNVTTGITNAGTITNSGTMNSTSSGYFYGNDYATLSNSGTVTNKGRGMAT